MHLDGRYAGMVRCLLLLFDGWLSIFGSSLCMSIHCASCGALTYTYILLCTQHTHKLFLSRGRDVSHPSHTTFSCRSRFKRDGREFAIAPLSANIFYSLKSNTKKPMVTMWTQSVVCFFTFCVCYLKTSSGWFESQVDIIKQLCVSTNHRTLEKSVNWIENNYWNIFISKYIYFQSSGKWKIEKQVEMCMNINWKLINILRNQAKLIEKKNYERIFFWNGKNLIKLHFSLHLNWQWAINVYGAWWWWTWII